MKIIKTLNYKLAYTDYNTSPPIPTEGVLSIIRNPLSDSSSQSRDAIIEEWEDPKKKKKKKKKKKSE